MARLSVEYPKHSPTLIVGVGASAGGLEAFSLLLKNLPIDTGMGLVLVQHLDPQHDSVLTHLLAQTTRMPVIEVTNKLRVEANHVYVIPPNTNMSIVKGVLQLQKRESGRGPHHSINHFLESLAHDQSEHAIGVILSGTAIDGTVGLEAIKAEGGITFAQDKTAKYDSMPQSAIVAGCVDFVLSPEKIASELARIAKHPYAGRADRNLQCPEDDTTVTSTLAAKRVLPANGTKRSALDLVKSTAIENGFSTILQLLRNHSGVDFSCYKSNTIHRRVTRRVVLNKLETLTAYAKFLKGNARELDLLFSDVLISVTSFFRNPDAFTTLKSKVFPKLCQPDRTDPLRVWVLGCSSGQEAYSIAMSYLEYTSKTAQPLRMQIFATDLNESLLNRARHGLFPKSLSLEISPERLNRFFVEEDGGYRINKTLREMCVFARQNLISDPPFSRMDLISCRNMMIYLEQNMQRKAFPTFHYALKPGGFLFLGASESVGQFTDLFESIDKKNRIFSRKRGPTPAINKHFPAQSPKRTLHASPKAALPAGFPAELNAQREADRVAVNQFAPPAVLINADLQVLQFRGATRAYLQLPKGKANFNVLKMARQGLMLPLRAAIKAAKDKDKVVKRKNIRVGGEENAQLVTLVVIPLKNLKERCFLIVFETPDRHAIPPYKSKGRAEKKAGPAKRSSADRNRESRRLAELERELAESRDYTQAIEEQYEAANDELQASGEEVQSANEELQSINEELETSKEELESNNEELRTVNDEMANRNFELNALNNDLNNLHLSVNMAIVLLAKDLSIRRFTAQAATTFNLQAGDIGRPIGIIKHNLDLPNLDQLLLEVVETATPREREVKRRDGASFLLRILPYLTEDKRIDGAVLVVVDIDALKRAEGALRESEVRYHRLFEAAKDGIIILDFESCKITDANPFVLEFLGYRKEELIGMELYQVGLLKDAAASIAAFRTLKEKGFIRYENLPLETKAGERREVEFVSNVYQEGERNVIQCNIRDVTERVKAAADLRNSEERFRALFDLGPVAVYSCDARGVIQEFNRRAAELWGRKPAVGSTSEMFCGSKRLLTPDGSVLAHSDCPMAEVLSGKLSEVRDAEVTIERPDGSHITAVVNIHQLRDEHGKITGAINCFYDITDQRRAMDAVKFLSEAGMSLFASLEHAGILSTLTNLTVPRMADWAFIDLLKDKEIVRLAVAHADPSQGELAAQIGRFPPNRSSMEHPLSQVLATGQSQLVSKFTEDMFHRNAQNPEHAAALRQVNPNSYIIVPLLSRAKVFGVLTLVRCGSRRRFDAQDLALSEELARRGGAAIDNSRLLQDMKESSTKLAEADRNKDEFLAMLAHELRNPLAPIKSATEILRMRKVDDPTIEKAHTILERQVNHMTRLVDDLLDTSRIQHRKVTLNRITLDLNGSVLAVLDSLSDLVKLNRHTVITELENSPPLYVDADTARVAQIVSNLLINAIKYTPKGGQIKLTTTRENGMAVIKVRDNGIGIESHMLKAIFDVFTQVEVSLERSQGGLGLGLKLVKELVEIQGGTVEARSEGKGKGSEFTVRFPEARTIAPPLRPESDAPLIKRRILVIDDNTDILDSMYILLTLSGHTVELAETGTVGVEKATKGGFDVALVDIGLPEMNGYEVAKKIRENPKSSDMALIALTGYGQEKDKRRAYEAGFDEHLTKPVDAVVLKNLLNGLEQFKNMSENRTSVSTISENS